MRSLTHFWIKWYKSIIFVSVQTKIRMHLSADALENPSDYRLVKKLDYSDIVPFILEYSWKRNLAIFMFFLLNGVVLLFLLYQTIRLIGFSGFSWFSILRHALLGLVILPMLTVPVHELIHGLVYLLAGAPGIHFGADLHQFIFYVTAHRYVVNSTRFFAVALSPFIIVSALLAWLCFNTGSELIAWSFLIALFAHSTMCIGDVAMISFFLENKEKKLYTFDDVKEKTSYFYEKIIR